MVLKPAIRFLFEDKRYQYSMPEITINQKLGQTIVEIRQKKGYTQAQLVRSSGFSQKFISDVELGKRSISVENLEKLTSALNVCLSDVFLMVEMK